MSSEDEGSKSPLTFYENFALGGAAAIISKTSSAPAERVKLLIQNQDEMIKAGRLNTRYRGITECIIRTFKTEGFLSFWKSNLVNCIRYFPTQALNFSFKNKVKPYFKPSDNDTYLAQFSKNIASGSVAGSASLTIVYSLDYARTRLANDTINTENFGKPRQFNGLFDVYVKTLRSDGIVGLYRGFVVSCWGIIFYRGCFFGFYDSLKPILFGSEPNVFQNFLLGYSVTVFSNLISYPFDTVRRRMMMTSGELVKYKGSIDCTMQIIKNEGYMSFMKGAGANIIRGIAGGVVLAGFDKLKEYYIYLKQSQSSFSDT